MGSIVDEVRDHHLRFHPGEEDILKPFLDGFSVTWGRRRTAHNTELSTFFLKPDRFMIETYGFNQEILLVYSHYPTLEPRTIQAAEQFLTDDPGKGRVERLNFFLVSEADDAERWMASYASENQESRIIIVFDAAALRSSQGDSWFVRNVLNRQIYGRDLFDHRLPLQSDTYFFGREDVLAQHVDAIKTSSNRGLFGLRKTGKTSLLYKLERMVTAEHIAKFFYYDCKSPSIRKLRWFQLLARIMNDVAAAFGLEAPLSTDEVTIADAFGGLIAGLGDDHRVVLVFDEIEYISPIAIDDVHWKKDFVDFWQTIWASQSRHRRISTIVAGVNPSVVEADSIGQIQNPLFGIVSFQYLKGLGLDELRRMIRALGKRMGLEFDPDAIEYLYLRYGGHPLLTRIACSWINTNVRTSNVKRPAKITRAKLAGEEEVRDSDLVFYCRHVVSELRQFYPDEYEMLELLASGQTKDFLEFAAYPEYSKHLEYYGLVEYDGHGSPSISIPVIGRYVGLELAKREGRKTIRKLVDPNQRPRWVVKRADMVIHDFRFLEKLVLKNRLPELFGPNSFPEADCFASIGTCTSAGEFKQFIDTCYRCFVESIANFGKSIGKPQYFSQEIKGTYPGLWDALERVRVYRHDAAHVHLSSRANEQCLRYLALDLEGQQPSAVVDLWFVLQQCVLDGLVSGIQVEINRLS